LGAVGPIKTLAGSQDGSQVWIMSHFIASPSDPMWPRERDRLVANCVDRTVIWDFDCVVADTEPLQEKSYRELLKDRGYDQTNDLFSDLIGHTESEIWEVLRSRGFSISETNDQLIRERRNVFLRLAIATLTPSWLALDLLPTLASVASRQLVVSNGDPETIRVLLEEWRLSAYFEPLQYYNPDLPVPAQQPKQERLEELLSAGRSVMFEDNSSYLEQARKLGAFCVAVRHSMSTDIEMSGNVDVSI